jgi:hypothetical protein
MLFIAGIQNKLAVSSDLTPLVDNGTLTALDSTGGSCQLWYIVLVTDVNKNSCRSTSSTKTTSSNTQSQQQLR